MKEKIPYISLPAVCSRRGSISWVLAAILVTLIFFAPPEAGAAIYRYLGSDGSIHFTDIPSSGAVKVASDSVSVPASHKKKGTAFCRVSSRDKEKDPHIENLIQNMCSKYGVDPSLVRAVISAESGYNRMAVSPKGAMGLMQLMPGTASSLGVFDPFDPQQNIEGGVRYLSSLLDRFGGNVTLALAAYNAGPGCIEKYGAVPPYQETGTYVKKVLASYSGNTRTVPSAPVNARREFFPRKRERRKKTSFTARKSTIIYRVTLNDGTVLYTNDPSSGF